MAAVNGSKVDLKAKSEAELYKGVKETEIWVSIPDDMEVPAPLTKKTFEGGLYAAYLLRNGFEDLRFLVEWIDASEKYEVADERPSFTEMLNYYNWLPNHEEDAKRDGDIQYDLLLPIKKITE
jgi:hypothetical protein